METEELRALLDEVWVEAVTHNPYALYDIGASLEVDTLEEFERYAYSEACQYIKRSYSNGQAHLLCMGSSVEVRLSMKTPANDTPDRRRIDKIVRYARANSLLTYPAKQV